MKCLHSAEEGHYNLCSRTPFLETCVDHKTFPRIGLQKDVFRKVSTKVSRLRAILLGAKLARLLTTLELSKISWTSYVFATRSHRLAWVGYLGSVKADK